jgi:hypothetical protein
MMSAIARTEQGSKAEDTRDSGRILAAKKQFQNQTLDQWPLSVVRCYFPNDWRVMYEAGLKMGNGREEQRAGARKFVEKWELFDDDLRACQLRLFGRSRYKQFTDCRHDIPVRRPEYVSAEIRRVLEQLECDGFVSSVDSNCADKHSSR